jgi:cell division protein FtsA
MVNSALVHILIDGYEITNPIGFQGKEVSVQLYTAFAPMIHIGALERVAEMLDLDLLAVAAEPFAVSRAVLGNDDHNKTNAILMDVGGGTTDLAVVSEGGVMGTKMFGIGGRAFSRSIERQLGVTYTQAEAIKLGLTGGRVPKQKIAEVEAALHSTLEVWTNGVQIALEEFTLETLPERMLLCGGGSSLAMLVDTLQESKWYSDLPFTKKPFIHHIQPNEVSAITDTS